MKPAGLSACKVFEPPGGVYDSVLGLAPLKCSDYLFVLLGGGFHVEGRVAE